MKPITTIILKYSGILLLLFLVNFWLFSYSSFNIPEFIPHTPVKINGVLLTIYIISILIFAQKEILRIDVTTSISRLAFLGSIIGVLAEFIFQLFRVFTFDDDRIRLFLSGITGTGIFEALISFFIAFQLKTKRTGTLVVLISVFLIIFKTITMLFPSIAH